MNAYDVHCAFESVGFWGRQVSVEILEKPADASSSVFPPLRQR